MQQQQSQDHDMYLSVPRITPHIHHGTTVVNSLSGIWITSRHGEESSLYTYNMENIYRSSIYEEVILRIIRLRNIYILLYC